MLYTQGLSESCTRNLNAIVQRALQEQVTPGLAFMAIDLKQRKSVSLYEGSVQGIGSSLVDYESYYDLASLTKPLVTALWAWQLLEQGKLDWHACIGDYIPCSDIQISCSYVWQLLNHSAGFPAHHAYYDGLGHLRMQGKSPKDLAKVIRRMILATPTVYPPFTKSIYSDLGYILLAWICERISQMSLIEYTRSMFTHIDMIESLAWIEHLDPHCNLHFNPLTSCLPPCESTKATASNTTIFSNQNQYQYVPTERCPWRKQLIQGSVHDDNAWLIGGVAGHAGLFGRLSDVALWACHWVEVWQGRTHSLKISTEMARKVCDRSYNAPQSSYTLGWDTPSVGSYSSAGQFFSHQSIGHLGFTGTSLWIDLNAEVIMILLTNRVYPQRDLHTGIRTLRPQIHNATWQMLRV
jgi:serine-type D-Ala-D-Ala carboxypeptidase